MKFKTSLALKGENCMNKKLKILIIILLSIIILWGVIFAIACFDNELEDTEGITTTLTLEDNIQNDTIYCFYSSIRSCRKSKEVSYFAGLINDISKFQ